jgi:hypothetical protein
MGHMTLSNNYTISRNLDGENTEGFNMSSGSKFNPTSLQGVRGKMGYFIKVTHPLAASCNPTKVTSVLETSCNLIKVAGAFTTSCNFIKVTSALTTSYNVIRVTGVLATSCKLIKVTGALVTLCNLTKQPVLWPRHVT